MAPWEGLFLEPTSLLTRRFGGNIRTFSSGMDLALELAAEDGGEGAMLSSLFGKLRGGQPGKDKTCKYNGLQK